MDLAIFVPSSSTRGRSPAIDCNVSGVLMSRLPVGRRRKLSTNPSQLQTSSSLSSQGVALRLFDLRYRISMSERELSFSLRQQLTHNFPYGCCFRLSTYRTVYDEFCAKRRTALQTLYLGPRTRTLDHAILLRWTLHSHDTSSCSHERRIGQANPSQLD
jgi:hypothetical protein